VQYFNSWTHIGDEKKKKDYVSEVRNFLQSIQKKAHDQGALAKLLGKVYCLGF